MVLSGGLIRGGQVESFGANMHHGAGRDQVGTVVVRSLEHRSRTREARTPSDQSLRERSFGFLYAYFLPLLGRDWTLALRTVLLIERAEREVKRRSCPSYSIACRICLCSGCSSQIRVREFQPVTWLVSWIFLDFSAASWATLSGLVRLPIMCFRML